MTATDEVPGEPMAPASPNDATLEALHAVAYRVAYRLLGEREQAADVAQDTLERALQRWTRICDYAEAWVVRVSTNRAIDLHRRSKRHVQLVSMFAPRDPIPDPYRSERTDLVRALRTLPRRQREVVVLRYLADLSELKVAKLLCCSPGTVKQHAHRGIKTLRQLLDADPSRSRGGTSVTEGTVAIAPSPAD